MVLFFVRNPTCLLGLEVLEGVVEREAIQRVSTVHSKVERFIAYGVFWGWKADLYIFC